MRIYATHGAHFAAQRSGNLSAEATYIVTLSGYLTDA